MEHELLRQKIKEKYGSVYKFANVLGYTQAWMCHMLKGNRKILPDTRERMAKLLDIPGRDYEKFFGTCETQRKLLTTEQRARICEKYRSGKCLHCPLALPQGLSFGGEYHCYNDIDTILQNVKEYLNDKVEVS